MGGVADAVGGLFGSDGGGGGGGSVEFNPYNVSSTLGQSTVSGQSVDAQLSPELQALYSGLLGRVGLGQAQIPTAQSLMGQTGGLQQTAQDVLARAPQFQEQAQGLLGRAQSQFDIARDPQAAIDFQRRAYGPELERQRLSQESRLLNQGLLGSTTGSLQREGLAQGQNRALIQGAQGQQQQAFQQGLGLLGQATGLEQLGLGALGQGAQQELARQQFEAGLQGQAQGQQLQQLQAALGLAQAPLGLAQLGGQYGEGQLRADEGTASLRQQADANQANFFASLVSSGSQFLGR